MLSPIALQLLALSIMLFSGGALVAQQGDSEQIRIDTVRTAAGGDFTVERSQGIDPRFRPVIERLVRDGWPLEFVTGRFADKRTVFIPRMVNIKTRMPGASGGESRAAYAWVNTDESAQACQVFMRKYSGIFDMVETRYGVDRQTIAALMRCETRHGSVTGDYHVFSVYASMSLMNEREYVSRNVDRATRDLADASESYRKQEVARIRGRAASRSNWAYRELMNMLKIERAGYADACGIYGSWAGAFGWGQFLPSSYLRRAVDGDSDGKIDLYNPHDVIPSVANYLSKAGYRIGDDARRRRAIRSYNPSTPYVESIIGLAARVHRSGDGDTR